MSFLEYLALIYIGGPRRLTAKTTLFERDDVLKQVKISSLWPIKVATSRYEVKQKRF